MEKKINPIAEQSKQWMIASRSLAANCGSKCGKLIVSVL